MNAVRQDITIDAGATYDSPLFEWEVSGVPVDLSTATAAMHIRTNIADASALLELDSAGGDIILNETPGSFRWTIAADITEALPELTREAFGHYDLEIYRGTRVDRVIYGNVYVRPEVTRLP